MNRHQKRAMNTIQRRAFKARHKLILARLAKFEKALGSLAMEKLAMEFLRERWPGVKDREIALRVGAMADSSRTKLLAQIHERAVPQILPIPAGAELFINGEPVGPIEDLQVVNLSDIPAGGAFYEAEATVTMTTNPLEVL